MRVMHSLLYHTVAEATVLKFMSPCINQWLFHQTNELTRNILNTDIIIKSSIGVKSSTFWGEKWGGGWGCRSQTWPFKQQQKQTQRKLNIDLLLLFLATWWQNKLKKQQQQQKNTLPQSKNWVEPKKI